jgi:phosphoribosylamine--glycine ligase
MGGYSPVPFFDDQAVQRAVKSAMQPVVDALRQDGAPYRGCLYAGLMVSGSTIQVLEYNARFGDPETQVVLPRIEGDLIPLLEAAARGELSSGPNFSTRATVGVVLASRGYPGQYQTGYPIDGLGKMEREVFVFHAGTEPDPTGYVTAGGRVLTVVALGDSLGSARERAYRNVERLRFEGASYRQDLALRELEAPALS